MASKEEDAKAWNNKGIDFWGLGKFKEAIECFNKALGIDPKDRWAWNNKGHVLAELRRFK